MPKQTQIISLFNHKGGVSKTTTTFNLGWMLAKMGKRTVIVDTDPQCNLTGVVLNFSGTTDFADFYEQNPSKNIRDALSPAFESKPERIEGVDCVRVKPLDDYFLLPGHLGLAEYEVTLGIAQELSSSIQALKNLPGAISTLLRQTGAKMGAEYMLVDMSPSVGALNQNILMSSDFFIIPCSPDYFCSLAIDSLSTVLPRWKEWSDKSASLPTLRQSTYPFPEIHPKFLGTIAQRYRPRGGQSASGFQRWIEIIGQKVSNSLVPALRDGRMVLAEEVYKSVGSGDGTYDLAQISDFNTLITIAQEHSVPPFALTPKMMGRVGTVLDQMLNSRARFEETFQELAKKILALTSENDS